jgi:glutamyl-tRNA synthetase
MVLNSHGEKLSKRDDALTLRSLREAGVHAPQIVGYMAWSLGLIDRPLAATASELTAAFAWNRIRQEDWQLPADLLDRLRSIR